MLGVRSRPLTQSELTICNQCGTYVNIDGSTITIEYEDLNKQSCKLKKKIDDETSIGVVQSGVVVSLLETKGSLSKILIYDSGLVGWISSKYAQQPTLVKINCP